MQITAILFTVLFVATLSAQSAKTPDPTRSLIATFIGNEAWHITDGEYTVMTDFPYQSGYSGYMTWDWPGVPKVANPDKLLIVTTHEHRDHFASELLSRVKAGGVIGAATIRAAAAQAGIAPNSDTRFGPIRVHAMATPHSKLEHYSYVIEWNGVRMYLPGDTEETTSLLESKNLDVAFVTPWLLRTTQRQGAKIDARRVIVVHHETGETIGPYQGSVVPRQGEVLTLEPGPKRKSVNPPS